jgi:L-fucose isomerase-like protein
MSSILDSREVEDFIWRLNNRMIRIAPEANNIFTGESKESLATRLAKALKGFEYGKAVSAVGSNPASVVQCRAVIAEAYAHGVIIDTDFEKSQQELSAKDAEIAKLREQNKKMDLENAELKEGLEKMATDLVFWKGRYAELDKRLKDMFKHKEGDDIAGV